MASINTNAAANQARQALAASQKELATSRTRIATGKAIGSAKDNGAIHSIATMMSAERSGWNVANDSLARGQSLIATASAGLDAITDLLQKAREKTVAYRDTSLSTEAKASIRADIEALLHQVDRTAMLAEFDGKRPLALTSVLSTSTQTVTTYNPPSTNDFAGSINWIAGNQSDEPTLYGIDFGPTPGRVDIEFRGFFDPDALEVWQGSQRVAATGQANVSGGAAVGPGTAVSGPPSHLSLDYDPGKGKDVELRVYPFGVMPDQWYFDAVTLSTPATTTTTTIEVPIIKLVEANYEFVSSSNGDLEGVAAQPMTLDALDLAPLDWNDPNSLLARIDKALGKAVNAASYYGERASSFDRLIEQNGRLADALETGVGNLVDADLGKESAKLQAGQIKESLATKALAIANAAPQWILALFKG